MMSKTDTIHEFHNRAKAEGDKLKAYVFTVAAAGSGLFFATLCTATLAFSKWEKICLLVGLAFFAFTVTICLIELHLNARRYWYFAKAKEQEEKDEEPDWVNYKRLGKLRLGFLYASYATMAIAMTATIAYLIARIT